MFSDYDLDYNLVDDDNDKFNGSIVIENEAGTIHEQFLILVGISLPLLILFFSLGFAMYSVYLKMQYKHLEKTAMEMGKPESCPSTLSRNESESSSLSGTLVFRPVQAKGREKKFAIPLSKSSPSSYVSSIAKTSLTSSLESKISPHKTGSISLINSQSILEKLSKLSRSTRTKNSKYDISSKVKQSKRGE